MIPSASTFVGGGGGGISGSISPSGSGSGNSSTGAALRAAAAGGDVGGCVRLLAGRRQVRFARDELGRTAVHLAASAGHVAVVRVLLEAAAQRELDAADAAGCTALQRAAADGHDSVVRLLIQNGALLDKQDAVHGNTAMHEASWKGYSRTVAILAASGANLSLTNSGGFTALHLCCQNGHNQSCRELLLAGCDPDLQNNYGDTSLHTAARYGHAGVTRILISAQCRVSDQNKNGDTALHIAAAMGRRKLTRILLEAACDRTLRNKQQETAMDIAIRKDLNEIVVILESTKIKRDAKNKKEKEKEKHDKSKKSRKSSSSNKVKFDGNKQWSPYGCHYYPDSSSFPKPKLDSLPADPLRKGEQYYLDLAGNIRKGPVGVGYTCYCAPLFKHMEERLERDKKELKEHIDQAHARLGHRVAGLEHRTRGHLQQLSRTAAMERARCERRHRHLEQWLARGVVGRHSERAPPGVSMMEHASSTLTRSKSLELLDEVVQISGLPPCKSLDELEAGLEQEVFEHGISTNTPTSSRLAKTPNSSSAKSERSEEPPRRTVAEIVAHLQATTSASPNNPLPICFTPSEHLQWSHSPPEHSESSDDEDRPLRLSQERGPMRDTNLVMPNYENVGTYRTIPNGGVGGARTRSGVYSPSDHEVVSNMAHLRLLDGDTIDRETNNDSGYSTKVYGSSKGNSPSLSGPLDVDKPPHPSSSRLGASSLV